MSELHSQVMSNICDEKLETNLITLSRYVLHSQKHHPDASGDLTLLLVSIQVDGKFTLPSPTCWPRKFVSIIVEGEDDLELCIF